MKLKKSDRRRRIHYRIRKKVQGTPEVPRLAIYRSNKAIYGQIIDDRNGVTLVAASSHEDGVPKGVTKTDQAKAVGKLIAQKALSNNINQIVFDRGGYLFHGRVKSLAEGAREGGLQF